MNEVNPPGGPPAGNVWIVGGPGCGKSTLAGLLADPGTPPVCLDALFWGPGWTPVSEDEFLAAIRKAMETRRWVVDGQFPAAVAAYAHHADCVVWVDPPLRVSWPRLLRRTLRRWIRREELWGGIRETFWTVVGPRSILWYALKVRAEQRQANLDLFARLSESGVRLIRFRGGDVRNLVGRIAR
ncbi:hypothetical protein ACFYNN_15370 [Streptomyces sp. NPDC006978]|uniref:hypothetical protein n=1 Tax=unclassified Streptomyces TaxID=2593676 RepID=UPI002AFED76A|nr:hypothetical protein [Streptomyces sp. S584]